MSDLDYFDKKKTAIKRFLLIYESNLKKKDIVLFNRELNPFDYYLSNFVKQYII